MKPRIRIYRHKRPEVTFKPDKEWVGANQFSMTVLMCWLDFLEEHEEI